MTFREMWDEISPVGLSASTGGYLRFAWSEAELALRDWFRAQAHQRELSVEEDGNGNLFAWWNPGSEDSPQDRALGGSRGPSPAGVNPGSEDSPQDRALGGSRGPSPAGVLTGSHFDSVPHGGAYDGPLGIVSGFLAVDTLRERGFRPKRPIGVAAFVEEEGSRFGLACLGSRLLSGAVEPEAAAALKDRNGITLAEAAGGLPKGARPDLLHRIGCYVELHVEQGRALADLDRPVGVASAIWPHGRWRLDFAGEGNHAGTTLMADRHDPMLTFAYTVLAANKEARLRGAHATIGRVAVEPNATNAIPARVRAWLDARAASASVVDGLVAAVHARAVERSHRDGTQVSLTPESVSDQTAFDAELRDRLAALLGDAPILPTGAGHDAGVLSAHVPTAMLFVRNPTGVSHSPAEYASDADCEAGVAALADVLAELAS